MFTPSGPWSPKGTACTAAQCHIVKVTHLYMPPYSGYRELHRVLISIIHDCLWSTAFSRSMRMPAITLQYQKHFYYSNWCTLL